MSDEKGPEGEEKGGGGDRPPLSLDALMTHMIKPIPLDTEGLGRIYIRGMTMTMSTALAMRMRDTQGLGNRDITQIFMGCTCTRGEGEGDNLKVGYEPLRPEEVDRLTNADVEAFAKLYMLRVLNKPALDHYGVVADHAKAEAASAEESATKIASLMADMAKSSTVMANWPSIRKALEPSVRLGDVLSQFKLNLGPTHDIGNVIEDTLGSIAKSRLGTVIPGGSPEKTVVYADLVPPIRPVRFEPPIGEVEVPQLASLSGLEETANKVAGDVEGMVVHVGQMSDDLKQIAGMTKEQVEGARKTAVEAKKLAIYALSAAIFMPLLMWCLDRRGREEQAGRERAAATHLQSQVELLREQNAHLRKLVEQSKNQAELTGRVIEQNTRIAEDAAAAKKAIDGLRDASRQPRAPSAKDAPPGSEAGR